VPAKRSGCILGLHRRLGEHRGDGFADEPHLVAGEGQAGEVVVHLGHAVEGTHVEVGGGEHRHHSRHGERIVDVDRLEAGVRHLGAHEHHVQGLVERQVGHVMTSPDEQFRVFRAQHARTEDRANHVWNLPPAADGQRQTVVSTTVNC
jgi:hypothetical protein